MPKIIQEGVVEHDPALWWVGKTLTCDKAKGGCGCVFQLVMSDRQHVQSTVERMGEERTVATHCPTPQCLKVVAYSEPNKGFSARPAAALDHRGPAALIADPSASTAQA